MDITAEHVDRSTYVLLEGSIELAISAEQTGGSAHGFILARSSIISTMLLLEACSNALIDSLALPKALADDLTKLQCISKFDLYCRLAHSTSVQRDHPATQGAVELVKLRNLYVHPKAIQVDWVSTSEISARADSPKTKHLGLPKIPPYVAPDHAIRALRAAMVFLRYILIERCALKSTQANALLLGCQRTPDSGDEFHAPTTFHQVQRWLKEHSIPMDHFEFWVIG